MGTGLLFSLPYHGHIHPCLPVVEELVRRGERIVAYTTDEFRPMLEDVGAEFRRFPHRISDKRALVTMAYWQLCVAASVMSALARDAQALDTEYVLVDASCYWGYALGEHLSLPLILFHSTFPNAFQSLSPVRSALLDLRSAPGVFPTFIRFLMLDRRISRRWRITPLGSPVALIQPRQALEHLVLAHESMQPERTGEAFHFVGLCLRRPGSTRGESLPRRDARPLVYVSLGTIWNDRPDFYRLCIEAYRDGRYQVLISTGSSLGAWSLGTVPDHIHIREHVDQLAVLERAAVFVSHGGMNSLSEALHAGVPLVLVPQANDQFPLSELMERQGVAVVLRGAALCPKALRETTDRVLHDPAMLARCRERREQIRSGRSGAHRAADLVFAALRRSRSLAAHPAHRGRVQ